MVRSDLLECFILGYALDLHRHVVDVSLPTLCRAANERCGDFEASEVLDALFLVNSEHIHLTKVDKAFGSGLISDFEELRNEPNWRDFFSAGEFRMDILPEGHQRYRELRTKIEADLSKQLEPLARGASAGFHS